MFELTAKNQYKIVHSFLGYDGSVPTSGLTLASNRALYGVTHGGGGPKEGNIYKSDLSGCVQVDLRLPG